MDYRHRWLNGQAMQLPLGKVVCVGRNYAEHARELNNPIPSEPLLFIKPATALASVLSPLVVPQQYGACHFETELAFLIGERLTAASPAEAARAIAGVGLGLDLTLRELQDHLKAEGHPWEKAKAFDNACPMTPFLTPAEAGPLEELNFMLEVNGRLRQQGRSELMLVPVAELLAYCSRFFTLMPGDVVLTGTPAGVGPVASGDQLTLFLNNALRLSTHVI